MFGLSGQSDYFCSRFKREAKKNLQFNHLLFTIERLQLVRLKKDLFYF